MGCGTSIPVEAQRQKKIDFHRKYVQLCGGREVSDGATFLHLEYKAGKEQFYLDFSDVELGILYSNKPTHIAFITWGQFLQTNGDKITYVKSKDHQTDWYPFPNIEYTEYKMRLTCKFAYDYCENIHFKHTKTSSKYMHTSDDDNNEIYTPKRRKPKPPEILVEQDMRQCVSDSRRPQFKMKQISEKSWEYQVIFSTSKKQDALFWITQSKDLLEAQLKENLILNGNDLENGRLGVELVPIDWSIDDVMADYITETDQATATAETEHEAETDEDPETDEDRDTSMGNENDSSISKQIICLDDIHGDSFIKGLFHYQQIFDIMKKKEKIEKKLKKCNFVGCKEIKCVTLIQFEDEAIPQKSYPTKLMRMDQFKRF